MDDTLVDAREARVSVFDRGFRAGEGVFETLRSYGGHCFRLDPHLERAFAGAAALGFDPPPYSAVRSAVTTTADANTPRLDGADAALRLTLTPGAVDPAAPWPPPPSAGRPTLVVTCSRLADRSRDYGHGVTAATVPYGRELPQVKALSYLTSRLAREAARQRGADEALLLGAAGDVLEGAASNVFAVVGSRLITPPLAAGILPGVTRGVVMEVAADAGYEVDEAPLPLATLIAADEALLTATTREVVPLVAVDGAPIGAGRPGRAAARLLAAYRTEVARERASDAGARRDGAP